MELKIEYLPLSALRPYEKNARKHKDKDIETIVASIGEFGMNDPIGIWGEQNIIVEGHGRAMACERLGIDYVPCIRLDGLTDEQRRAYTLAHNKTAEMSSWDWDILDDEIGDLIEWFDMSDFGFDIVDEVEEHEKAKQETEETKGNILNLGWGNFKGVGKYDIPQLDPVYDFPDVEEWIGFNYVLSDENPENKGVHFFLDDYQFERVWNNPTAYIEKLKKYKAVLSPDFSPYMDMPMATQIYNHYRKHWCAKFWQENGINVIPTIRASMDERSLEWFTDGEPYGGIVAISAMWTSNKDDEKYFVEKEYKTMVETLSPKGILVYGGNVNIDDGIEKRHINTFAEKRFRKQDDFNEI